MQFFSYMESNIIKTYLLNYIFDIMENRKFKYMVYPHCFDDPFPASSSSVHRSNGHSGAVFMRPPPLDTTNGVGLF